MKERIFEQLKKGETISSLDQRVLELSDLLEKDENGVTYLEYACKNATNFSYANQLCKDLLDDPQALLICAKCDYFDWVYKFNNEEVYFELIDEKNTLLDYLLSNNIKLNYKFFENFKFNVEIIDYLIKYKSKKINTLSREIADLLITKKDGKYLLDKYSEYEDIKKVVGSKASVNNLFLYCRDVNDISILKYSSEHVLTMPAGNGKSILEALLDRNITPEFYSYWIKSKEVLDILIKYNRIDLLYNGDADLLLTDCENGKTYFDLMVEKQKEGVNVHLEKARYNQYFPSYITAQQLIKLAEAGFPGFYDRIDKTVLLHKGKDDKKSVLEYLVEMNREVTITQIMKYCFDKKDPELILHLKMLGIDDFSMKIKNNEESYINKFISSYSEFYAKDCESICPDLISQLDFLFGNDNKSDLTIVKYLVQSYTYLTSVNHPDNDFFKKELEQIIAIKANNFSEFCYLKSNDGSYFNGKAVYIELANISTINHETSHALHSYLSHYKVPDNYDEIILRARNNPQVYDKLKDYSKKFFEIYNSLKEIVSEEEILEYNKNLYQGEKLLELSSFLAKSKEEKKVAFIKDYNEQVLDTILAGTYSIEEFIKQKSSIEYMEAVDVVMRNLYNSMVAISDIIDAVFMGKFFQNVVYDENNSKIDARFGHGIAYYRRTSGFKEMVADYGEIIKSDHREGMIEYLRSIVGDEIVDMIKDVYEKDMIESNIYLKQDDVEEVSNAR